VFPTNYNDILERIDNFNPLPYAKTRNFADGAVSRLSPYISRGVISTQQVFRHLKAKVIRLSLLKSLFKNWPGETTGNRYG
jgi:deoxyribodipyrimidine photo-lyase